MTVVGQRVDGLVVVEFASSEELASWLASQDRFHPGVWVRVSRKHSPRHSVTFNELLELGIAYGWSESTRCRFDDHSYLQRFSPRRTTGTTSQRNLVIARKLIDEGRMTDAGRAALGLGAK